MLCVQGMLYVRTVDTHNKIFPYWQHLSTRFLKFKAYQPRQSALYLNIILVLSSKKSCNHYA